jgi:biopolymer transport protein TolR
MAGVAPRSNGRGRRAMNDINMVPFIDVMLVLLIIFMVTAPLISPTVIDVPSVGKASSAPEQVINVEISQDGKIVVKSTGTLIKTQNSDLKSLADDVQTMLGEASNTPVVITADRSIKYETVVKAMDTLQRAGIARVGLAVQLVD